MSQYCSGAYSFFLSSEAKATFCVQIDNEREPDVL